MIRTLRNSGFGQLFLGSIVVAIILAFVFTGAPSGSIDSADDCAVEVGKNCVSPKEFFAAFRLMTSIGLNDGAVKSLQLREKIARGLAERDLLLEEAHRLGLATSEDDIDNELLEGRTRVSLPAEGAERLAASLAMCVNTPGGCAPGTIGLRAISVTQNGAFDFDLYKRNVRVVTGRSPTQFKEMQQLEYTAERVRDLIRSQVRVTENEAFLAYFRARSKATARTVDIPTAWFARFVTMPTDEEVKTWVDANQAALDAAVKESESDWELGCPVVSEIRLNNSDPTSEEANAIKAKAEELQKKARVGGQFGQLASRESDADSATLAGRVGCLSEAYGTGSATLIEAAVDLTKASPISPVVETLQGFHVLKLVDHVTDENKDALLREYLSYKLASNALAQQAAKSFAEGLIEAVKGGMPLAEATDQKLAELLANGPFSGEESRARKAPNIPKSDISRPLTMEQEPISNAESAQSTTELLFDLENEDDVVETPIVTSSGFAVLQLKSKELVTRESFKETRADIMARLQKRKAEQALSLHIAALVKKAGGMKLNPKYVPPLDADETTDTEKEKGS